MIRQLNRDDPLDVADYESIFEGHVKFQYTNVSEDYFQKAKQLNLNLLKYRHNYVFGKYDEDLLIGTIHFEEWNDGVNYHMGLMVTRRDYPHPKTMHPIISDTRIELMNYGVGFFEAFGLTTCYTTFLDDPRIESIMDVEGSIFKTHYDQEIVERVPEGTSFPWIPKNGDPLQGPADWRSRLIPNPLPGPQIIKKLTRKS